MCVVSVGRITQDAWPVGGGIFCWQWKVIGVLRGPPSCAAATVVTADETDNSPSLSCDWGFVVSGRGKLSS